MSLYSLKPMVVLQRPDRRSRLHLEEGGGAEPENDLDMHIEDLLRYSRDRGAFLWLLTGTTANEIDLDES